MKIVKLFQAKNSEVADFLVSELIKKRQEAILLEEGRFKVRFSSEIDRMVTDTFLDRWNRKNS